MSYVKEEKIVRNNKGSEGYHNGGFISPHNKLRKTMNGRLLGSFLKAVFICFIVAFSTFFGFAKAFSAGYGSVPLPPSNVQPPPGGSSLILSVTPIVPGQPLNVCGTVDGLNFCVQASASTFASSTDPLELVVTSCSLQSLGNAGFAGYTPYACIGAYVVDLVTGMAVMGPYDPAVSITLRGSSIQPPAVNLLAQYNFAAQGWNKIAGNSGGVAAISETAPEYYLLLAQNSVPVSTIPGATPKTGKAFLGEEVGAGILIALGIGGLILFFVNKRRHARG